MKLQNKPLTRLDRFIDDYKFLEPFIKAINDRVFREFEEDVLPVIVRKKAEDIIKQGIKGGIDNGIKELLIKSIVTDMVERLHCYNKKPYCNDIILHESINGGKMRKLFNMIWSDIAYNIEENEKLDKTIDNAIKRELESEERISAREYIKIKKIDIIQLGIYILENIFYSINAYNYVLDD